MRVWPDTIESVEQLDELLSRPGSAAVECLRRVDGDVVLLGAGGKMGPTLGRMLRRAADDSQAPRRIIAVSRFSNPQTRGQFADCSLETIAGDLTDRAFVERLPDAPNVFYLCAMKFGATGNEPLTWGMNAYVPTLVAERYRGSRIVAFSTGNIYGLTPVAGGGSRETDTPAPVGEYAMSCLARERLFQYVCDRDQTPTTMIRLNYAVELRYGVLVDLALRIMQGEPIDLSMGYVNVVWQGDACNAVIASLADCAVPVQALNVTGPTVLRVRSLAERLAEMLGRHVEFTGVENQDALLNNAQVCHERYGLPEISIGRLLRWTADWIGREQPILGKPTHFEVRSGRF